MIVFHFHRCYTERNIVTPLWLGCSTLQSQLCYLWSRHFHHTSLSLYICRAFASSYWLLKNWDILIYGMISEPRGCTPKQVSNEVKTPDSTVSVFSIPPRPPQIHTEVCSRSTKQHICPQAMVHNDYLGRLQTGTTSNKPFWWSQKPRQDWYVLFLCILFHCAYLCVSGCLSRLQLSYLDHLSLIGIAAINSSGSFWIYRTRDESS